MAPKSRKNKTETLYPTRLFFPNSLQGKCHLLKEFYELNPEIPRDKVLDNPNGTQKHITLCQIFKEYKINSENVLPENRWF